jgi:hypothetical protein
VFAPGIGEGGRIVPKTLTSVRACDEGAAATERASAAVRQIETSGACGAGQDRQGDQQQQGAKPMPHGSARDCTIE